MKKLAEVVPPQLDVAAELAEVKTRLAALEALVEKHHPTPKLETLQPYPVGSNVYSVTDPEARYPIRVLGYRGDRILVITSPGEPERELQIESVVPFSRCRNAETNSEQAREDMYARMDPAARKYYEGRRKAQLEAITKPSAPFTPPQKRYS